MHYYIAALLIRMSRRPYSASTNTRARAIEARSVRPLGELDPLDHDVGASPGPELRGGGLALGRVLAAEQGGQPVDCEELPERGQGHCNGPRCNGMPLYMGPVRVSFWALFVFWMPFP